MPADKAFIDSNAFLYSVDETEDFKRSRAQDWITGLSRPRYGITNLQVLNEVTNVLLKRRRDIQPATVFTIIDGFARFGSQPVRWREVSHGRKLRMRFGYSWWDCLLLASALELGCKYFLSEDLQDGQDIEGLTILSPFAHSPDQILASR